MSTKLQQRLQKTAYHEAGHVIAAIRFRRPFRYVTIEPEEDSLGHVLHKAFSENFNPESDILTLRHIDQIERVCICSYAGAAALGKFHGTKRFDWTGADHDRQTAIDFLSYVTAEPEELGAYVSLLEIRTWNLVRNERNWRAIIAVADELLVCRRMTARKARLIVRESDERGLPPIPASLRQTK